MEIANAENKMDCDNLNMNLYNNNNETLHQLAKNKLNLTNM